MVTPERGGFLIFIPMTKLRTCPACQFYARGGKSRIAMKHTCGKEPRLNTFKLPKFELQQWVEFVIQRTEIQQGEKVTSVKLQAQEIEGIKIPQGFYLVIPSSQCLLTEEFSSRPKLNVRGWKANEVLKTIVMEGLRNG